MCTLCLKLNTVSCSNHHSQFFFLFVPCLPLSHFHLQHILRLIYQDFRLFFLQHIKQRPAQDPVHLLLLLPKEITPYPPPPSSVQQDMHCTSQPEPRGLSKSTEGITPSNTDSLPQVYAVLVRTTVNRDRLWSTHGHNSLEPGRQGLGPCSGQPNDQWISLTAESNKNAQFNLVI